MSELLQQFLDNSPQVLQKNIKYAPKMSFADRCAALAAVRMGINKKLVALAFGVNVSTIEYVASPSSRHYKDVRKEYADLGHERFVKEKLTDDYVRKIMAFKDDARLDLDNKTIDAGLALERAKAHGPDRRAKGLEGKHSIFDPIAGSLWVHVEFVQPPLSALWPNPRPEGWYVRYDPASPGYSPEMTTEHHGAAADANTSKSALSAFLTATGSEER